MASDPKRWPDLRLGDLNRGEPTAMRARADRIDAWCRHAEAFLREARRTITILREGAVSKEAQALKEAGPLGEKP